MTPEERENERYHLALSVLKQCEYAVLATIDPEGNPYCIPVSPACLNGAVYFHCGLKGQKLDHIQNCPQVCLTGATHVRQVQDKYTMDFDSFVLRGTAEMVEDREEKIAALRAISERYAPDRLDLFETVLARSLDKTGICKITPVKLTGRHKRTKRE